MSQSISIFDIFKIGVGPSSSHTLGPWKASLAFVQGMSGMDVDHIKVHLYGSLSKTGKGHATDKALVMGLCGLDPVTVDVSKIDDMVDSVISSRFIELGFTKVRFDPIEDIVFEPSTHELHPNTLRFVAYHQQKVCKEEFYMSVGGGFIETTKGSSEKDRVCEIPFPVQTGKELLMYASNQDSKISDVVLINELIWRSNAEFEEKIEQLYKIMKTAVYKGCNTEGTLPGGLQVSRRASGIAKALLGKVETNSEDDWFQEVIKSTTSNKSFDAISRWVSCFALAVNEENAAMGRIVTSPTNGAAGVIPAVLLFYMLFDDRSKPSDVHKFFLVAGEIGCLFKKGATISAAVGGCQAEIGVSSAMAAAALCEMIGGSPAQSLMAAEIAMEHHLGLTCDPIGGLVQIPCIERNAMGAMKAITAANLAIMSDSCKAKLDLDSVIKAMWETAQDMNHKYKETSEGGLALALPVIHPNC